MTAAHRFQPSIAKVLMVAALAVLAALAYTTLRTRTVPDATFVLLSGQKITTAELRGKVYLVNFWATSCATCIKEMPDMIRTYEKFKDKDFEFIAVAMQYDPPQYVINYTQSRHLPFKVALDPDGSLERRFYNVQMTPTTFLVDKKGRILKRFLGEPGFPALHGLIERALAQTS
ncbi:MAG: TlpA family protein disulfide reductase [Burkholderiales bacterium]|uniref:TlpA disulfide reductase family protein n=1 Tax=Pandoraea sp. TaxID=1883445 RepID=UPI001202F799|nr:TlpA disulfide reductase family protein [Pandoraea sp.]MDE2289933.1 TlpA family protein disulfide reductase [Burkholderiales bacterium]MDE2608602.1 TlpA family protein disulfide reductase [Burkholderiales bacterium]TAL80515.1 MAG: TlpA family protein disulfide reductase [Candidimonas sp.]TAM18958.1 MAG: TlpA family protein disulfide reductase [Pandoraea sp.]